MLQQLPLPHLDEIYLISEWQISGFEQIHLVHAHVRNFRSQEIVEAGVLDHLLEIIGQANNAFVLF